MVYHGIITSLSDLIENVEHHAHDFLQLMLLLIVESAILRFQAVADNGGHHTEHVLLIFVDYLYVFNKPMIRHLG